jgi:TATA-box binding protein (TBP) (component of TFIID and TFIIIB)
MTAMLDGNIDLDEVAASFQNVTFNPEKIMRASIRFQEPKRV